MPSDAIQRERIAVRRVRGSDCWLTALRYDGRQAGKQARQSSRVDFGWSHCAGIARKNCIASVSSGPVLQREWPRQRMSSPAISSWLLFDFDGDCGGGTPSTFHSTLARIDEYSNCSRKACWRRSPSRSVVISAHPEDQQCRLPGPEAVTPRATGRKHAVNLELTQPAKAQGSTMDLFQAGIELCASVLHHTSDCPGKRVLATPVTPQEK